MYRSLIKPFFDTLFALLGFLVALPIFLIVALLLAIFQQGQVFFVQPRPGKGETIFKVIKFKTMRDAYDELGNPLPDEERLTWIGKFVRKTSLDEIPQLLNIIKGDMSFIGPRPWLVEYLELYTPEQRRRHEVRPGISGWAQVNGRNALSWDDRFKYDLYYVDHISLGLDLKILFLTIAKVFKAEGISAEGKATVDKFTGS